MIGRGLLLALVLALQAPASAPAAFTEVEALRVQNLNLERVILERQVKDWQAKQAALKADIERRRPGWLWDPETGKFTTQERPQ